MDIVVAGGGRVGCLLAEQLDEQDQHVVFLDSDPALIERVSDTDVRAYEVDIENRTALADVGDIESPETVVVATDRDSTNLLVTQFMKLLFDSPRFVVRLNDSQNRALFEDLGIETVYSDRVLATALAESTTTER